MRAPAAKADAEPGIVRPRKRPRDYRESLAWPDNLAAFSPNASPQPRCC
jgi:hypothetical protein